RAEQAEEQLRREQEQTQIQAHLAHARSFRHSGQVGQRFKCLEELAKATRLDPSPDVRRELRAEVVACLALADVKLARSLDLPGVYDLVWDASFERYACFKVEGPIRVCRALDDRELLQLPHSWGRDGQVRFSPKGRFLGVSSWGRGEQPQARIWDLERGQE